MECGLSIACPYGCIMYGLTLFVCFFVGFWDGKAVTLNGPACHGGLACVCHGHVPMGVRLENQEWDW